MKTLLTILILGIFSSCNITGHYFSGDGFNNTSISLANDHSFTYFEYHDAGGKSVIEGKWVIQNDTLVLNSTNKPSFHPNSIVSKQELNNGRKLIIIQYMDVDADGVIVSLNNGQEFDTTRYLHDPLLRDSLSSFSITGFYTDLDSIQEIQILKTNGWVDCGLLQSQFILSNPKATNIRIFAQPFNQYFGMRFLINTKWLLRNNKIYNRRKEDNTFDEKSYLKKH